MRTFFLFFISIIAMTSVAAQGVSMSPTRLFFTGAPGETVTEKVILHNSSNKDYVLSINYKDWKRELDGNKIYFESGALDNSNASWLSTLQNTVSVAAGATKEVLVTMQIPENASTSELTNSMLFFTQLPTQEDKTTSSSTGLGIITLFEFGLHVYYTPLANNNKSLEITNIEEITDAASKKAAISITNDGNVVNDATVEFELTNTETGEEIKLDPTSISMMPDTHQVVQFNLPEGISGEFLGVAIIKMAGSNDLRVGEKHFSF
ncbi:fimbrial biogenesis chaperone [Arenibacter latericius]|uniref:hypothetical protein n=1 Tax=Arenibacter latericius TaxID=86104 RepID=UPI00041DE20D|nr:hypothetical protein [Arenibacter latericius]